jgi:hypothetical protein
MRKTRGDRAIAWFEEYCRTPCGPDRGRPARLSPTEMHVVRCIYDAPEGSQRQQLTGTLAAYVALLHVVGIEAPGNMPPPVELQTDPWTVWNAADNPALRRVLERKPDAVVCPALGTKFPWAA